MAGAAAMEVLELEPNTMPMKDLNTARVRRSSCLMASSLGQVIQALNVHDCARLCMQRCRVVCALQQCLLRSPAQFRLYWETPSCHCCFEGRLVCAVPSAQGKEDLHWALTAAAAHTLRGLRNPMADPSRTNSARHAWHLCYSIIAPTCHSCCVQHRNRLSALRLHLNRIKSHTSLTKQLSQHMWLQRLVEAYIEVHGMSDIGLTDYYEQVDAVPEPTEGIMEVDKLYIMPQLRQDAPGKLIKPIAPKDTEREVRSWLHLAPQRKHQAVCA